jgi:L-fuculose-phosphate aldolase
MPRAYSEGSAMPSADMNESTRERLIDAAQACRILDMEGHGDMTLGHLSVRADGGTGFWMKRNRIGLGEVLGPDDFVLVGWDGRQLAGSGSRHSEWPIHSEIFRLRADLNVVVHAHPLYASIFSAMTGPLEPYTLDADYFVEVPRHTDDAALVTTTSEGEALARSLGSEFAVLMSNHGVTYCGTTIQHAVCVGIFLEKACKAQLIGSASGLPTAMPSRTVRDRCHKQIMTPVHWEHCWHYFCRKLEARAKSNGAAVFS